MLRLCVLLALGLVCSGRAYKNQSRAPYAHVVVHADTLLEVDGQSTIPPLFGIILQEGDNMAESSRQWMLHLQRHNIDTVGLSQTLGHILPSEQNTNLSLSGLQYWLMSGSAHQLYQQTSEYLSLKNKLIRKAGARPFLFLQNPDGECAPACQQSYCWNKGGTPRAFEQGERHTFGWWALLFAGYLDLALKADPSLDLVHIWNEPDRHFCKDGKNGTYYAEFFTAVASRIKNSWPGIKLGGPVSSVPPTGPFQGSGAYKTWSQYIQPLVDSTASQNLLDFIDFHVDVSKTGIAGLLSSIETTVSYALVRYGAYLPVTITEMSFTRGDTSSTKELYHANCTFPLLLSTFALFKYPDKVVSRLLANNEGASSSRCQSISGSPSSPEANAYYLLGKLLNGTHLLVNVKGHSINSSCRCHEEGSTGSSPVLGEAALVGSNITIALLNKCTCEVSLELVFEGIQNTYVVSSWAATLDKDSITRVHPVSLTEGTHQLTMSPLSLYLATYQLTGQYNQASQMAEGYDRAKGLLNSILPAHQYLSGRLQGGSTQVFTKNSQSGVTFTHKADKLLSFLKGSKRPPTVLNQDSTNYPFPVELTKMAQLTTAYPVSSKWIMSSLPSPVPCNYCISVLYDIGRALDLMPSEAFLRVGFLGAAGVANWTVSFRCSYYRENVTADDHHQPHHHIHHQPHHHIHHQHHHHIHHQHHHHIHHQHHHHIHHQHHHHIHHQYHHHIHHQHQQHNRHVHQHHQCHVHHQHHHHHHQPRHNHIHQHSQNNNNNNKKCQVNLISPGPYLEVQLPQFPWANQYGYVRLTFTSVCTRESIERFTRQQEASSDSYLAFSSIILHSWTYLSSGT